MAWCVRACNKGTVRGTQTGAGRHTAQAAGAGDATTGGRGRGQGMGGNEGEGALPRAHTHVSVDDVLRVVVQRDHGGVGWHRGHLPHLVHVLDVAAVGRGGEGAAPLDVPFLDHGACNAHEGAR
jgi:hypothetical protein